jgi:hypothetical protein
MWEVFLQITPLFSTDEGKAPVIARKESSLKKPAPLAALCSAALKGSGMILRSSQGHYIELNSSSFRLDKTET